MCGIAGFITAEPLDAIEMESRARSMADRLSARGPDDSGTWVHAAAGIAFGFRRLAINDLSEAGHQPMKSASGRYVIVFNGEIYNFLELSRQLGTLGYKFRGHSDTEVLLAAIEEWELESALGRAAGMFAFALWDRDERLLHLVRDRVGIKPLYYGWSGSTFLFGSELKALRANPAFVPEIDPDAVALQLRHRYVPQPYSIYRGIKKLPPGTIFSVRNSQSRISGSGSSRTYWSAMEVIEKGNESPFSGTDRDAIEQLDALLGSVVSQHMIGDVPTGAFLSGGVDSSTVVSLMQAQTNRPVKTFSVGFHEDGYNEAQHAKLVATQLGTDHTEIYVTARETLEIIPRLPALFDEPFSDSSQIPTLLVSTLARRDVVVSLSGDGGDELFGGYNRYVLGPRLWRLLKRIPKFARRRLAEVFRKTPSTTWNRRRGFVLPFVPSGFRLHALRGETNKCGDLLVAQHVDEFYKVLISSWVYPEEVILEPRDPAAAFSALSERTKFHDFTQRMMFFDLATYLPDDILTKVDRASMSVSLEARVPLLDHRVVEFAARVPLHMKIRNGRGKWLLREVLRRHIPQTQNKRPKMGFSIPVGAWLRGPLRDWAEDLLGENRLRREGHFRAEPIRQLWSEHLTGRSDGGDRLWTVLMFEAWLQHWTRGDRHASYARPQLRDSAVTAVPFRHTARSL
jgi:asparagine synthase (glutamine-hydrolysing)